MSLGIYLRPTGLLYGADARAGTVEGWAGPVAGGPVAYALAEILEGDPGATSSRTLAYRDLAAVSDSRIDLLRSRIEAPRALSWAGAGEGRVRIMGIVNVTPDSFSDGGLFESREAAISHGMTLMEEGADVVDVGGESTRPGSEGVSLDEELGRVLPVIEAIAGCGVPVSIDTRKSAVITAAVAAGAAIVNDISALSHDPAALATVSRLGVPVVLMHAAGEPKTMQDDPRYADAALEIFDYLEGRIAACEAAGIPRDRIMADPGIGFGKTYAHNLQLIAKTSLFHGLGVGLVFGASRKGFIGAVGGVRDARRRAPGSIAAALAVAAQGAQMVRVHDVAETAQALAVWQAFATGMPRP